MKKSTIVILGLIMSVSFLALLSLQVRYIEEIVSMRHEQFDESVKRSLYNAAHKLELDETKRYLEKNVAEAEMADRFRWQTPGIVTRKYDFKSDGSISSFEMRTIIIPQALRNILPPLFNEFIMLVKETSIVGYVGIYDLGKIPGLIQSRTFDYLFPLLIAAALYLIVVLILTKILHVVEKKMAKSDRNAGGVEQ